MEMDNGAPCGTGSHASHEAPEGLRPSGFDPSRVAWLHVRGQFTYHAEAHIVGTRTGLLALRTAIDKALADRESETSVCASDGEGYTLTVRRAASVNQMGDPTYIDEMARSTFDFERQWVTSRERHNWSLYQKIKEQIALRDSDEHPKGEDAERLSGEGN